MRHSLLLLLPTIAGACAAPTASHRGVDRDAQGARRDGHIHFSHPLIGETPSPDTKVRVDGFWFDVDDAGAKATVEAVRLEGEYAFDPSFSVEVDVPYVWVDPDGFPGESDLGTVEAGVKFANFAFERHGLLLGYGLELGLPTGDDDKGIASDHVLELEPFLSIGYKRDALEITSFVSVGVPTNLAEGEEVENELGFNLSTLYHVTPTIEALLELDGESVLNGDERGHTVVNLSPGIKVAPTGDPRMHVGFGVGFPITDHDAFDVRAMLSFFYHF